MTTITSLPNETIIFILKYGNIDIEDVVRFGSTCARFQELIQDNNLWRQKYFERYPWMEERRDTEKCKKFFAHLNFKEQIITIIKRIKNLQDYLFALYEDESLTTQNDIIKEEFNMLLYSIAEDSTIFVFISTELDRIVSKKWSRNFATMCTTIFDCNFILQCLQNDPSNIHMNLDINEIKPYPLPHVSYSIQNTWLDDIEQEILSRLKNKYPAYPIIWISSKKLSLWEETKINDTFWDETEIIQIVEILDEYVFSNLMLHKLAQLWWKLDPNDHRSESAHFKDRILYATYHSVASRLRIDCDSSVDLLDQFLKKKAKFSRLEKHEPCRWYND
ncbi:hypothetical protein CAJAP_00409 [Camponotus japonicus]